MQHTATDQVPAEGYVHSNSSSGDSNTLQHTLYCNTQITSGGVFSSSSSGDASTVPSAPATGNNAKAAEPGVTCWMCESKRLREREEKREKREEEKERERKREKGRERERKRERERERESEGCRAWCHLLCERESLCV